MLHAVLNVRLLYPPRPVFDCRGRIIGSGAVDGAGALDSGTERSQKRLLLIGFDSIAEKIFRRLREPLIGVVTGHPALVPAGTRCLGDLGNIERVLQEQQPTNIVVSMKDWAGRIPPSLLLNSSLAGVTVEESRRSLRKIFSRVCCERLQPVELHRLFAPCGATAAPWRFSPSIPI